MANRPRDELAGYYDDVPYDSRPYSQSSPEHLATRAFTFGLSAPDLSSARVLELGCGGGSNLIPFAARYPQSTALGIDLSTVQIAQGLATARRAGLSNIDFRTIDLTEIDLSFGLFDYIICHGVYSWVPHAVQDAILRICNENLAPDGVAYISYNVYPGWKTREIVRDAMRLRGGPAVHPADRLALGLGMLDILEETASSGSLLRTALDDVSAVIRSADPSYVLHEYLEPFNAPCYFKELMVRAEAAGLTYLAEAASSLMFAQNYPDAVREFLIRESDGRQVVMEQYIDFFSNRSFRQTLFVKDAKADQIRHVIDPFRVHAMYFTGFYSAAGGGQFTIDDREQLCSAPCNRPFMLRGLVDKAVVLLLDERFPACMSRDEIVTEVAHLVGQPAETVGTLVSTLLKDLVQRGSIYSRNERPNVAAHLQPRPRALEANCRIFSSWPQEERPRFACNQWHDNVNLTTLEAFLLSLTDGSRSYEMLEAEITAAASAGFLNLASQNELSEGVVVQADIIRAELMRSLESMRRKGLFVA